MQPLFTCVMPVKGPRPFMDEALESLRMQGLGEDLEVIIQDGDAEKDDGLSDALNRGFAKAHGEWLFWLNADDILLPGALQKIKLTILRLQLQTSTLSWLSGNVVYIDKDGTEIGRKFNRRFHPWLYRHMPVWTYGPSSFFRRELWERHGGLDTSYRFMMDIELWTRWVRAGERFAVIPDYLWGFRVHAGSLTTGGGHDEERQQERDRFYAQIGYRHPKFWLTLDRLTRLADGSCFK